MKETLLSDFLLFAIRQGQSQNCNLYGWMLVARDLVNTRYIYSWRRKVSEFNQL